MQQLLEKELLELLEMTKVAEQKAKEASELAKRDRSKMETTPKR